MGLVRRLVEIGLRYRLRELQLLLLPCAVAFLPAVFSTGRSTAVPPLVSAMLLSVAFLASNVALSVRSPWLDQHLLPIAAMLIAAHAVLGGAVPAVDVASGQALLAAQLALYAALGVRLARLAIKPRAAGRRPSNRWPLYAGAVLLLIAASLVTAVFTEATVRFAMAAVRAS